MSKIDATGVLITTRPRKGKVIRVSTDVSLAYTGDFFHLNFNEPGASAPLGKERGIRASVMIPKEVVGRMVIAAMAGNSQAASLKGQDDDEGGEAT